MSSNYSGSVVVILATYILSDNLITYVQLHSHLETQLPIGYWIVTFELRNIQTR